MAYRLHDASGQRRRSRRRLAQGPVASARGSRLAATRKVARIVGPPSMAARPRQQRRRRMWPRQQRRRFDEAALARGQARQRRAMWRFRSSRGRPAMRNRSSSSRPISSATRREEGDAESFTGGANRLCRVELPGAFRPDSCSCEGAVADLAGTRARLADKKRLQGDVFRGRLAVAERELAGLATPTISSLMKGSSWMRSSCRRRLRAPAEPVRPAAARGCRRSTRFRPRR